MVETVCRRDRGVVEDREQGEPSHERGKGKLKVKERTG